MGLTAVGIGVGSGAAKRRAMRLYNDASSQNSLRAHETTVSMAFTQGGLGMQIAF